MAASSSEDLRNLLRAAQVGGATPAKSANPKFSGAELADLQSLIGSVNVDIPSVSASLNSHNVGNSRRFHDPTDEVQPRPS